MDQERQPNPEIARFEQFKPGVYQHYKGSLYEAIGLVSDADDGRVRILYASLELDDAHEGPRHHVRDFNEFLNDKVHQDGSKCQHDIESEGPGLCADNQQVLSRFTYLGPTYERWMSGS